MRDTVVTKASNASETLQPTQTPLAAKSLWNRFSERVSYKKLQEKLQNSDIKFSLFR